MTPEQQHFWNVLKFDPKTMADELGNLMQDARLRYGDTSDEFYDTVDRCLFLSMQQCQNDIDLLRMTKHWLSKMQLPFDANKMKSTDPLHNRIGSLVSKLSDSHTGKPHPCPPLSVETRLKIANSLRGQTRSDDVKKRMSEIKMGELNPFYGKTHSAETRQKQSIALKGKSKAPMSEEAKRKLSESQKKRLAEKRLIRLQSSNEL